MLHIYHSLPPAPCLHYAVLDVASGKVAHTLAGHSGGTNGLAFLSGNSLVSVGEDGTARLWNVARAACVHELPVDAEGADRWAVLCLRCAALHCALRLGSAQEGFSRNAAGTHAPMHRELIFCGIHQIAWLASCICTCLYRAGRRGHCVNHLSVAPGAKSFACAAGRLVTIFTLGSTAQQAPSKRVLGPLESTVGGPGNTHT